MSKSAPNTRTTYEWGEETTRRIKKLSFSNFFGTASVQSISLYASFLFLERFNQSLKLQYQQISASRF